MIERYWQVTDAGMLHVRDTEALEALMAATVPDMSAEYVQEACALVDGDLATLDAAAEDVRRLTVYLGSETCPLSINAPESEVVLRRVRRVWRVVSVGHGYSPAAHSLPPVRYAIERGNETSWGAGLVGVAETLNEALNPVSAYI